MKAIIYISGKIVEGETLLDVVRQFKSFDSPSAVLVIIKSIGGDVDEGGAIYNYLVELDKTIPVTTSTDQAYSIASKIFAAGSTRRIADEEESLMIHFAWVKNVSGDAEVLEMYAEHLRKIEKDFISFYSEFLNIDKDTISAFLKAETYISGQKAVEIGFATEIYLPLKAVAEFKPNSKNNNNMILSPEKKKNLFERFLALFEEDKAPEIKAEVILVDSNSQEIKFPDLEEGTVPSVGDKATLDGSTIPDGSYIMPSLEESTVVFVDGVITEIIEKVIEEEAVVEEAEIPVSTEASLLDFEKLIEKSTAKIKAELEQSFKIELDKAKAENVDLKKKITGKEIKAEVRDLGSKGSKGKVSGADKAASILSHLKK